MPGQTSQQIMQQIQQTGEMPNFQQEIAKAYDAPVLRPLVNEAASLESQYLPAMFEPFAQMGTGAADMSPAAKLAMMGGSLGRLSGRIGANNSIQNFYGAQIGDLANQMTGSWKDRQQNLWNMYNATAQQEEAKRQEAARQRAAQPQTNWADIMSRFSQQEAPVQASPGQLGVASSVMDRINRIAGLAGNSLPGMASTGIGNATNTLTQALRNAGYFNS